MSPEKIQSSFLGIAVGDALGVPVEFQGRGFLDEHPVVGMIGYGTHNQKPGTWSDDSSLTFCLAESLCTGFDLQDIANRFVDWYYDGYWTAWGHTFDIGITTRQAIDRVMSGSLPPELCGGMDEFENGNGSLMRILPLVFYLQGRPQDERYHFTKLVSSITHGHFRSYFSCFIYIEYLLKLLDGLDKQEAYVSLQKDILRFGAKNGLNKQELDLFNNILRNDLRMLKKGEVKGSGYVVESLEASLWCFLRHDSYEQAVLEAVNLGSDTDTTGAITGGLAGLYYGMDSIPHDWIEIIARKDDILDLGRRLAVRLP